MSILQKESLAVDTSTSPEAGRAPPLLIGAEALAKLLACSVAHVWRMHASGRVPCPVKLGKLTRWRRVEVEAWVRAGCPARATWELISSDKKYHWGT